MRRAFAPGRVNLIGEHTDYTGGYALPMALDLGTTVEVELGGVEVVLTSVDETQPARVPLDVADPASVAPTWGRIVAAVVAELRPAVGAMGRVTTTLPIGAGLSSSAALELAVALALGFDGSPIELARLGQRVEHRASGVPCGLMDQLASAAGLAGHALLIDFATDEVVPVRMPPTMEVIVVHSGTHRALATSAYADRVAACGRAESLIGPLREASAASVAQITDPTIRRRARHVVSENARVLAFVDALRAEDHAQAGELMMASHRSLREDYEVSTPVLDELVERLCRTRGVHGARLTGAGFGGCAVALAEPGALEVGWRVSPADGARVVDRGAEPSAPGDAPELDG